VRAHTNNKTTPKGTPMPGHNEKTPKITAANVTNNMSDASE
jgi:hypothetical protein